MFKKNIPFILFIFLFSQLHAQESMRSLNKNTKLQKAYQQNSSKEKSTIDPAAPIHLPFIDDFSGSNVYPSSHNWIDSNAFINNTYAISPISIGVATLDAIDKKGDIHQGLTSYPKVSDYLCSRPLRLDSITTGSNPTKLSPADSILLSFYIQPQGIGNYPDPGDSIALEFKSFPPDTSYIEADTIFGENDTTYIAADTIIIDKWRHIWSHPGMSYQEFTATYNKDFLQVLIPITDSIFFRKDFQFRFKNYCSLASGLQAEWAGNADMWHIDYVYIDKERSTNAPYIDDIAVYSNIKNILKDYTSMPWSHFLLNPTSEMGTTDSIHIRNLSNIAKNTALGLNITDIQGNGAPYNYNGGSINFTADTINHFLPELDYTFSSNIKDSAIFKVSATINTTPDANRSNDSAHYYQRFYNYYAYDDGTPEFGYGLTETSAKMAVQFDIRKQDTLRGIQILFNSVVNNANAGLFKITIWDDLETENILYQSNTLQPLYKDSINDFYLYRTEEEIIIPEGTVYIGLEQISDIYLHIGWDANNTIGWDQDKGNTLVYYNTTGEWRNSLFKGALMIRPVLGKTIPLGIQNKGQQKKSNSIRFYPNPATDLLNIKGLNTYNSKVTISDLSGRTLITQYNKKQINTTSLPRGYYIIRFYEEGKNIQNDKLIILR